MANPQSFQDQHHVEQIRKHLWIGREVGQAAVMVGAGFSWNADPILSSTPPLPLLADLARTMYRALYASASPLDPNDRRMIAATSGGGVLRLSQEYKEVFGREQLDELLI